MQSRDVQLLGEQIVLQTIAFGRVDRRIELD
jgi:hypothetical protein